MDRQSFSKRWWILRGCSLTSISPSHGNYIRTETAFLISLQNPCCSLRVYSPSQRLLTSTCCKARCMKETLWKLRGCSSQGRAFRHLFERLRASVLSSALVTDRSSQKPGARASRFTHLPAMMQWQPCISPPHSWLPSCQHLSMRGTKNGLPAACVSP